MVHAIASRQDSGLGARLSFPVGLWLFVLASLGLMLLPSLALAQQGTLTDDAYTSSSKANKNFGGDETIVLTATTEKDFLKFKLTPNLPTGTVGSYVGKATLKLFIEGINSPGTLEVHTVLGAWSEATITDSTAPALGPVIAIVSVTADQAGKWVTIDLSQSVKDWLDGTLTNNGVALIATGGADMTFDSKENSRTSHEPRLEIVLNHASTADQATTATTADTANSINGVLPANKGGTGLNAPGTTGNVLRSNGTNWTSAPLVASDFPGLANSFIQNQNSTAQIATFNIAGNGTAGGTLSGNVVNATTQFNIGGQRVLSVSETFPDSGSTYLGLNSGNSGAGFNAFFGRSAGSSNTSGGSNSFFGFGAGFGNTSGLLNSFFGGSSGVANTTGANNTFFGGLAGGRNTTGSGNTMVGAVAGFNPGVVSPGTGSRNTFLGISSGQTNIAGSDNTLIGANGDVGANNLNFATAIGANAVVNTSDTIVLGKTAATYNGVTRPADTVQIPGDLNVTGSLTLSIVNANTQYNLGGSRILSSNLGLANTSLGLNAGTANTGANNSFFGTRAGAATTTGNANAFFGDNAGGNNANGDRNSFFGSGTGFSNVSGTDNSFFGFQAGINSTTSNNSFFGSRSGVLTTTGNANALFGDNAGASNTTGSRNSFFGSATGFSNRTGGDNAFFGFNAGFNNTQNGNSFFGTYSGYSNTTGDSNSFVGYSAGYGNTTGVSNTFVGSAAGYLNSTGSNNSFVGRDAGINNATGSFNSFFGRSAGLSNTTGGGNSFFGVNAGQSNTKQSSNTFIGYSAGNSNGTNDNDPFGAASFNTFVGSFAGQSNTTGGNNSFFGSGSGAFSTTGSGNAFFGNATGEVNTADANSFFGAFAGQSNTTGASNSFFGSGAGNLNTSGLGNAFFGYNTGAQNKTGAFNSFFGYGAGNSNNGQNNSFFGWSAGYTNQTGLGNSFFGAGSGQSNTEGGRNSFIGYGAGGLNTKGTDNAFFGDSSGFGNTEGNNNTFVGPVAGQTNTIGESNTTIGFRADVGANNLSNATAIGANAQVTQSNSLVLGSINGVNGATADTKVGIGITAPGSRLTVAGLIETTTGGVKFPDGTIQTTAVTGSGSGVSSLNTLTGNVTLAAGPNVTITPSGNTLTIASTGGGGSSLSVRTEDGATAVSNVTELRVSNGTLTNDGSGSVSITTGGGGASNNAILNQTTQQSSANFNIDGTGKANIFNAATQYNIGNSKLISNPGQNNLFVGVGAEGVTPSLSNDILENTFFGTNSGKTNLECCNAFFGNYSGQSNTNGSGNTFLGYQSAVTNTTGSFNTIIGINAGSSHQTGDGNTYVGDRAGIGDTNGVNNTFVGRTASIATGASNLIFATAIGANAVVDASNTVVIGKAAVGQFPADTVRIPGDLVVNGAFSNPSDARLKTGVTKLHYGLTELMHLRPVTWTWRNNSDNRNQLGLIAQEVKPVLPELVIEGNDKDHLLSLNYIGLLPIVIRAIQEQQATIASLRNEVASLQGSRTDSFRKPVDLISSESSAVATTYNGNITTDANGQATIVLTDDFESHYRDFRYQLTVIGQFARAIVSTEIRNNRFTIRTDEPHVRVSWQVTGIAGDESSVDKTR